ncbi:MAG: hypothetical protein Q7K26_06560 [bacterium]|nr:hypothetical protein [bacterium]
MARKSKSKGELGAGLLLIFLFVLASVIVLLTIVSSFVLIGYWAYYKGLSQKLPTPQSKDDFVQTREENRLIAIAEKQCASAATLASQIETEGAQLSKRKDRQYDERSELGKRLNAQTSRTDNDRIHGSIAISVNKQFVSSRYDHHVLVESWQRGFSVAMYAYFGVLIAIVIFKPQFVVNLSEKLNSNAFISAPSFLPNLWGAMFVASVCAALGFFITRWFAKKSIESNLANGKRLTKLEAIAFSEVFAQISEIGNIFDKHCKDSAKFLADRKKELATKQRELKNKSTEKIEEEISIRPAEVRPVQVNVVEVMAPEPTQLMEKPSIEIVDKMVSPQLPIKIKSPDGKQRPALWLRLIGMFIGACFGFIASMSIFITNLVNPVASMLSVIGITLFFAIVGYRKKYKRKSTVLLPATGN